MDARTWTRALLEVAGLALLGAAFALALTGGGGTDSVALWLAAFFGVAALLHPETRRAALDGAARARRRVRPRLR